MIHNATVDYECKECGFSGIVDVVDNKATCPSCGTTNDVWEAGGAPPPNHSSSKPTTSEIVAALRDTDNASALDWLDEAADRLEMQESIITELAAAGHATRSKNAKKACIVATPNGAVSRQARVDHQWRNKMSGKHEDLIHNLRNAHRGTDGFTLVDLCNQAATVIENDQREIADQDAQIKQYRHEQNLLPDFSPDQLNRPKAMITLGDLQRTCTETGHSQCLNAQCSFYEVCPYRNGIKPRDIDLDSPVCYSEKTISLFRSFYQSGATIARVGAMVYFVTEPGETIGMVGRSFLDGVVRNSVIDLVSLFASSPKANT